MEFEFARNKQASNSDDEDDDNDDDSGAQRALERSPIPRKMW